jgi:hydroxymethylpyrimidine pyrophosphatase-like HAD family hydrolase
MIKAVVLDVDGVIVGDKIGVNSPYPHPLVLAKLKDIRLKGIPVVLCTAKPHYSIQTIISEAGLANPHITSGGAVIIDPVNHQILKKCVIPQELAREVAETYLDRNIYTEVYTVDNYYLQKNQVSPVTDIHAQILQRKPVLVDSILEITDKSELVKIMPVARDDRDKIQLTEIFLPFENKLTLSWGMHPVADPLRFGIITAAGISKKQALLDVAALLQVSPSQMLGVGDSTSDWQFIGECGYAGAMGNASKDLQQLVLGKGGEYSHIGPPVDENGILEILAYFGV